MPDDYEGEVVCTLVKKRQPDNAARQAILYLHGYNDYFFQKQMGDSTIAHGYDFYALDLRKYGRSLLPHQDPFFCKNLNEYFADIDTALSVIRTEGYDRVFLMAHSTGGLISACYLSERENGASIDGLILNSPFLDWNLSWFMENIAIPVVSLAGKWFPGVIVQGENDPNYAYSLLKGHEGEWEFDTGWKMPFGHPKKAGWIRAIQEAQRHVQKGLTLECPILLLSSDRSFPETATWHEEYKSADIVLDIKDIQKYGQRLGRNVTRETIPGGIHDLVLSPEPARGRVYQVLFEWLRKR